MFRLADMDRDEDSIIALHSVCFADTEMPQLQVALDDKRCFVFLGVPLSFFNFGVSSVV